MIYKYLQKNYQIRINKIENKKKKEFLSNSRNLIFNLKNCVNFFLSFFPFACKE